MHSIDDLNKIQVRGFLAEQHYPSRSSHISVPKNVGAPQICRRCNTEQFYG